MSWIIKKLEGKDLLRWQTWICMLLVVLMLVTSLGTVYKIEVQVPDAMRSGIDAVVSVLNEPEISGGKPVDFELPDTLDVNVILFIKFASKTDEIIDIYNSMLELAQSKASSSGDYNKAYRKFKLVAADAIDLVTSSEFENAVALAATLVSAYETGANKAVVITLMSTMAFVLPSCLFAALLWAILDMILSKKNAEKRYLAATNALRRAAASYMFVIAIKTVSQEIHLSLLLILGILLCAIGFFVGAIFSRATRYTAEGRAYMSVLQRMSAIQLCGFAVFYIFVCLSGAVGKHLSVAFSDFVKYAATERRGEEFLAIFMSIFTGIGVIACLVGVLEAAHCSASRLGGFASRSRESALISSLFGALMIALSMYGSFTDPRAAMTGVETVFLLVSVVGLGVMIACEIMIPRLRRKKCPRLHESEKFAVLVGLEVIEVEDE